jgi:hypothetical protein
MYQKQKGIGQQPIIDFERIVKEKIAGNYIIDLLYSLEDIEEVKQKSESNIKNTPEEIITYSIKELAKLAHEFYKNNQKDLLIVHNHVINAHTRLGPRVFKYPKHISPALKELKLSVLNDPENYFVRVYHVDQNVKLGVFNELDNLEAIMNDPNKDIRKNKHRADDTNLITKNITYDILRNGSLFTSNLKTLKIFNKLAEDYYNRILAREHLINSLNMQIDPRCWEEMKDNIVPIKNRRDLYGFAYVPSKNTPDEEPESKALNLIVELKKNIYYTERIN